MSRRRVDTQLRIQPTTGRCERTGRHWGSKIGSKSRRTVRIVGGNIGGLRPQARRNPKLDQFRKFCRETEADVVALQELQVNWDLVQRHERLYDLLQTEVATRVITSHNTCEKNSRHQHGGTAVVAFDIVATKITTKEPDPLELGRWCSIRFDNGIQALRVISAYQPIVADVIHSSSVYQQHRRVYLERGDDNTDPRRRFREDLCAALRAWRTAGEALILFIDANEDIRSGPLQEALRAPEIGMIETMSSTHPQHELPATHERGSRPIDGVFTTEEIDVQAAAYLAWGRGFGDHRTMVLDIPITWILPRAPPKAAPIMARRVTGGIPRSQERYNRDVERDLQGRQYLAKCQEICERLNDPTFDAATALGQQDRDRERAMRSGEKRSRKLRMGQVAYSKFLNTKGARVRLWKYVIRQKLGRNVSSTTLRRRVARAEVKKSLSVTLEQAYRYLDAAREDYYGNKPDAVKFRD